MTNAEITAPACSCCDGDPKTVCDACGRHSCWAGTMFCEDAATAGTRQTTPADELAAAEEWARYAMDGPVPSHLVTLMAEYERRRVELLRRADLCDLLSRHIEAVRAALDVAEDADLSGPDSADVRAIHRLRDAAARTS